MTDTEHAKVCAEYREDGECSCPADQSAVTAKPALPARILDPFPRIPIDTRTGSTFADIQRIAARAATTWVLGDDGPYKKQMPMSDVVDGAVREALMHLLELGFIDVDEQRLREAPGWPMHRERPAKDA